MVDAVEMVGHALLFILVFCMSCTVDIGCLAEQVRNKYAILTGIFLQFGILPLLGFAVVKVLALNHAMGITLLVVTSSPGGSYSNWWCSMFNADLALSVTMTAISTVLSVVMLPVNLLIYSKFSYEDDVINSLDWVSLFIALVVVIGAIGLGLFASSKAHSHRFNILSNKIGNFAGIALVIFSATMSSTGGEESNLFDRTWKFYFGVAAPCVIGLGIANIMTSCLHLKKPERVTVSVECCYQNVGIATSVALTMFDGDELTEAMGVPLYYGLVEALVLGIYCIVAWKIGWTKAPASAPFCTIISTSYEVLCAERLQLEAIEISISEDSNDTETTSDQGNVVFHYFHFRSLDIDVIPTKKRVSKQPSGASFPPI